MIIPLCSSRRLQLAVVVQLCALIVVKQTKSTAFLTHWNPHFWGHTVQGTNPIIPCKAESARRKFKIQLHCNKTHLSRTLCMHVQCWSSHFQNHFKVAHDFSNRCKKISQPWVNYGLEREEIYLVVRGRVAFNITCCRIQETRMITKFLEGCDAHQMLGWVHHSIGQTWTNHSWTQQTSVHSRL